MLALRCPGCGEALPSHAQRRVWYCAACGSTSISNGRDSEPLRCVPRILARPELPFEDDELLYLMPTWIVTDRQGGELRIPAQGIERMTLILSLADRLTALAGGWSEWSPPRDLIRSGAELHYEEAFELAALLRRRESGEESGGLERFGMARLVDWPCVRRSSQLIELVGGRAASGRILDSLEAVGRGPSLVPLLT